MRVLVAQAHYEGDSSDVVGIFGDNLTAVQEACEQVLRVWQIATGVPDEEIAARTLQWVTHVVDGNDYWTAEVTSRGDLLSFTIESHEVRL